MVASLALAPVYAVYPERRQTGAPGRVAPLAHHPWTMGRSAGREAAAFVAAVRDAQSQIPLLSGDGLQAHVRDVASQLRSPRTSYAAAVRCFALTQRAVHGVFGFNAYDEQILGAWHMLKGRLVEMETGEGKTLAAVFSTIVLAMHGFRVHVVTTNDYLADRDASQMGPVYARLGLSVGCVKEAMGIQERQAAYGCSVTYVTPKQLMFDYLRDQVELGSKSGYRLRTDLEIGKVRSTPGSDRVFYLHGLQAAIIDEADSILIDEAIVPLILSKQEPAADQAFIAKQAIQLAGRLTRGRDFAITSNNRNIELTDKGTEQLAHLSKAIGGVFASRMWREQYALQALMALHLFQRDHEYIVRDGSVQIVDVGTGRTMPDRSWERGLQQMIQAKEGLTVTAPNESIARISHQDFFCRYLFLAGMSGTLTEVAPEIRKTYGLGVVRIPTHQPSRRRNLGMTVCRTTAEKRRIIIERVKACTERSQPVLIGTRAVADSEQLSEELTRQGIDHTLLNARYDAHEAEIIAGAGRTGVVTVATNMAGRGTDIRVEDKALEAGGLHVIAAERHESRRIDRQLFGRTGRQGDPGTFEEIVSFDDKLISGTPFWQRAVFERFELGELLFRFAQWRSTRHGARLRRDLARHETKMQSALSFAGSGNDVKKR